MKTWDLHFNGSPIRVKCLKARKGKVEQMFHQLDHIGRYRLTQRDGYSTVSFIIGGADFPVRERATFDIRKAQFAAALPDVLTVKHLDEVMNRARAIFRDHVAIEDTRSVVEV